MDKSNPQQISGYKSIVDVFEGTKLLTGEFIHKKNFHSVLLLYLFNTRDDPHAKNSNCHLPPTSRRHKAHGKGQGLQVSCPQSGRCCQRVVQKPHFCLHCPLFQMTALYQSKAPFLWPQPLPGAPLKVRGRQTDYTASLEVIIQPCRFWPSIPVFFLFFLLQPSSLTQRALTPFIFW